MTQRICSHRYDNGLVLVAEPMDWLESAAYTILVPSGCANDPIDRSGLTSFTCEMALRGAGPYDSRQYVEALDNLGAERSEGVGKAHTRFGAATLADNLGRAMSISAELLLHPHMPEGQLEQGRQVMYQELRSVEDEPSQKLMVELRRCHYPLAWGRPSYGDWQPVEQTSIDDIRRHYESTYRPNGTIIGVAGRFDWPQLVDHVGELLGDWQPKPDPAIDDGPRGPHKLHLPDETAQTHIGLSWDTVPYSHDDYFLAWSGVSILSGGTSARLFNEVREKRGLCYSIYASYHTLLDRAGIFCYAGTGAERAQETLDVTIQEVRNLARGIQEDELRRLKARIKSSLIMQQESSSSRSGSIASDWYHLGRVRPLDEIERIVGDLTCDRINRYLADHQPSGFTVVTLGPDQLNGPHEREATDAVS